MRTPISIKASSESAINIAMSRFDLFFFLAILLRTAAEDLPIDLLVVSALMPVAKDSAAAGAKASGAGGT